MLARMRTIKEAMEQLKTDDPNTALREYCIRDLVNNNLIPYVRAGRKILINYDGLCDYLNSPAPQRDENMVGGIRKINV